MTSPGNDLGDLFQACDLDGSGFIDREELASICPDLTTEEVDNIFSELDGDGDGNISVSEFVEGFKGLSSSLLGLSRTPDTPPSSGSQAHDSKSVSREHNNNDIDDILNPAKTEEEEDSADSQWQTDAVNRGQNIVDELGDLGVAVNEDLITTLSCQEQVCELYQNLHASSSPQLLSQFEDIILSVIKDIRQQQCENERLEESFKKEKDNHVKQIQEMEEELETHMSTLETKIRREERDKLETEKNDLRASLENEILEMQNNMKKLQKLENELLTHEKPSEELRHKLEEMNYENRYLQSNLTDSMTQLALLRSEMASIKQNYEEKCYELQNEKHALDGYLKEQDNLSRQVHILQDANKKLHDTNDDLREALDSTRVFYKRSMESKSTPKPNARQDYVTQYLASPHSSTPHSSSSLAEEIGMSTKRKLLPVHDSCEIDSLPEDFDSGHSTMPGAQDMDSDPEAVSPMLEEEAPLYTSLRPRHRLFRGNSGFESNTESELADLQTDVDTEIDLQYDDGDETDAGSVHSHGRCSACSRSSSRASVRSSGSRRLNGAVTRKISPAIIHMETITKEPERMFKVVLAGDAAVGKSSFILRLCKNKFVNNLNSTLGVDFQTKTIESDGRVVALQLWDTAGQERFRSIAKSYFRRADGVLLVYDCTYERSFINVREWVTTVEESADKKLPIMFVANKTDLRDEFMNDGRKCIKCVSSEDGRRLAREYDGLFIETSAKHGDNILEAVTELARLMRANEDLEVHNVGLHLQETSNTKNKILDCCSL